MNLKHASAILGLAALGLSACGLGAGLFDRPARTHAVALVDLDGDGDLDAFLANGKNETAVPNTVWLNDGLGAFSNSGVRLGQAESHWVDAVDLDGDGHPDVVVGNAGGVVPVRNDGSGGLQERSGLRADDVGAYVYAVAHGDLDGDGDMDLFLAGCCGGAKQSQSGTTYLPPGNLVWLNNGAGNFMDSRQRLGPVGGQAVALGDLDGDGDLDAFVGNSQALLNAAGVTATQEPDAVWLNDGVGRFIDSGQRLGRADTYQVALGDLDRDGDLDALAGGNPGVLVWINDGLGTFSGGALGPTSGARRGLFPGDLDGDGDLDILTATDGEARAWLNDGAGLFADGGRRLEFREEGGVGLGDQDGDGDLDIFVGYPTAAPQVWLNDGAGRFELQP
jgi:hypothetical protein